MPDEYIDYILCKKFHCLPSELDKQDNYIMNVFLDIIETEIKEENKQYKKIKQ